MRKTQSLPAWEYLIEDYLEIACGLGRNPRKRVVKALKRAGAWGQNIKPCHGFITGKQLVVLCAENPESFLLFKSKSKIYRRKISDVRNR